MAPTSCGLTMVVVCALVLLTSMLPTTTANALPIPYFSRLFPEMFNDGIHHLVHYDLVLSLYGYNHRASPASDLCRWDGFKAIDLSTIIHDNEFRRSFYNSTLRTVDFYTGERYEKIGTYGKAGLWYKFNIKYFDSKTGQFSSDWSFTPELRQLCVRQTDVNDVFRCNNMLVKKSKFVSNEYTYSEARTFCRLRQGFDLPTHRDYVMYYAHHDPKCNELRTLHPWVQDDKVESGVKKKFICAGCRVHFQDLAGVKRIESNGTLTCKEGWYTDLPVNKIPRCYNNGYWDINTVGRCRQTQFSLGHTKYFLLLDDNGRPRSLHANTSWCKDAGATNLPIEDVRNTDIKNKIKYLLATWSESATAWFNNEGSHQTIFEANRYSPEGKSFMRLCKRTCEPLYNEFTQHDLATGDSYCPIANYMWTCRDDNCPRRGKATMPTCDEVEHGGKRTVWTTALCKKQDNRILKAIDTKKEYTVDFRRAEFRCAAGWYQDEADKCGTGNTRCAGGPGNYPVKPEKTYFRGPFSNIPTCQSFAKLYLQTSNVEVHVSKTAVTAEWARWVCQSAGMNLYSELFYSELPVEDKHSLRTFLNESIQQVWMTSSTGTIGAGTVRNTTSPKFQDPPIPLTATATINFMCVKYHSYYYPFKNFVIDYGKNPEACPDTYIPAKTDGFEKCFRACVVKAPANGFTKPSSSFIKINEEVTYSCYYGFSLVGEKVSRCDETRTLTAAPPICKVLTCIVEAPANGNTTTSSSSIKHNEEVTYSCNDGFSLVGEKVSRCDGLGGLRPGPPMCVAKTKRAT